MDEGNGAGGSLVTTEFICTRPDVRSTQSCGCFMCSGRCESCCCCRVTKGLRILKCSDTMMWYRGLIGRTVLYLGSEHDDKKPVYWTREPGGWFKNIILQCDAEVINIDTETYNRLFDQAKYLS